MELILGIRNLCKGWGCGGGGGGDASSFCYHVKIFILT